VGFLMAIACGGPLALREEENICPEENTCPEKKLALKITFPCPQIALREPT